MNACGSPYSRKRRQLGGGAVGKTEEDRVLYSGCSGEKSAAKTAEELFSSLLETQNLLVTC